MTALDQFNSVATGYTGTVQFIKTDSGNGSAVPANYTFVPADNGVKVFALGDDDLLANGTIVDQGGPGAPMPVPTLSTWATIVLVLALLVVGAGTLRRRSTVLR